MTSDNVMGAGNQQERLDPNWIVGFVDGEGCFHVALNRQEAMRVGWQVLPEFRVVQHSRDRRVLEQLEAYFGCGKVTVNNGDRLEFRVRGLENLLRVARFFEDYPLRTRKRYDFERFAQVLRIMETGAHLTQAGLEEVATLTLTMNRRESQSASRILRDCTPIAANSVAVKIQSDPHGDVRRPREIAARRFPR